MGWKNSPYWLRGSLVIGAIGLFYLTIIRFQKGVLLYPLNYIYLNYFTKGDVYMLGQFIPFIINIIFFFILGSLLGFIYGKIKARKSTPMKNQ